MTSDTTDRYPFGREALVPLMVLLQGVALLGTCVYAAMDAVRTILGGGATHRPDPSPCTAWSPWSPLRS